MSSYVYPVITGSFYNLHQKISLGLSIPMDDILISSNVEEIFIDLPITLTAEQKTQLDTIMANNPGGPPENTCNTTYRIINIDRAKTWLKNQLGIDVTFWYDTDSNGNNCLVLQFSRPLTTTEKNTILNKYRSLIREI